MDNKDKKKKVFVKKKNIITNDEKDDFFRYDKEKSKVNIIDEDFFDKIDSIDYEKIKIEKEKALIEKAVDSKVLSSDDVFKDDEPIISGTIIDREESENINTETEKDEVISEEKAYDKPIISDTIIDREELENINTEIEKDEVVAEDKPYDESKIEDILFEEEKEDFGSVIEETLMENNEEADIIPIMDTEIKVEDSIFEKYGVSENSITQEESEDNYSKLFDDSQKNTNTSDILSETGVINKINRTKETFFDDDDDFGSLDDISNTEYLHFDNSEEFKPINKEFVVNDEKVLDDEDFDDFYVNKKGKKKKKKSKLRLFFKVLFLLLISCSAMAVYFGLTHDLFKIDYIDVKGNIANDKEIIISKSGVGLGDNIFLSRASKIKRNLKTIPSIENVEVKKNYPNIIEIDVKENYVSSYINDTSGITTIDNYGKIKSVNANSDAISGIQIKGLSESGFKVGEDFSKDALKTKLILEMLTKSYYNDIVSVDFSKDTTIQLKNSINVVLGDLNDYSKKLKVLDVLLKKIQSDGINVSEIILNVGENPIIVKK